MADDRAAGRAGGARRSSAGCSTCRSRHDLHVLEHWLEPVVGAERAAPRRGDRHEGGAGASWRSSPRSRHRASPSSSTCGTRLRADRARGPRARLVLRRDHHARSSAAPARKGFEAVAWFDRNVIDGAVNGVAAARPHVGGGAPRSHPDRASSAATPWASSAGVVVVARLLPHEAVPLMLRHAARERGGHGEPSFPILTALIVAARGRRAARGAGPPSRRPELLRLVALLFSVATGALAVLAAGRVRAGRRPASSSRSTTSWIADLGISLAPRRRRHLAVPRRADRRAVPDRHARRRPAPRRQAVLRLAAAARGRLHRASSWRSTSSCSSCSSRSCSCRCTSSSAGGATATGSTRR